MRYLVILFLVLFLIPAQSDAQTFRRIYQQDNYSADFKEVKENDLTWILIVSQPGCPPCDHLYSLAKRSGVKTTKIDISHPVTRKLSEYYAKKGLQPINSTPDWVIVRYKDGKLTYSKRYLGSTSYSDLLSKISEANSKTGFNYRRDR